MRESSDFDTLRNLLESVFPLSDHQLNQFIRLEQEIINWNQKINLISRKDINNLRIHHLLHSLSIAKFVRFKYNSTIMDLGSGGGFPGIPLSILFPEVNFVLVESKQKKVRVLGKVVETLKLHNIRVICSRIELFDEKVDQIVCRGFGKVRDIVSCSKNNLSKSNKSGWWLLKGGNIGAELKPYPGATVHQLNKYFQEPYFNSKVLIRILVKDL